MSNELLRAKHLTDLKRVRAGTGRSVCVPKTLSLLPILFFDQGTLCTVALADSWKKRVSSSDPARTDIVQSQERWGVGPTSGTLLAHQDMVHRTYVSRDSPSLADSPEEGPSVSGREHHMAPTSRPLKYPCLALLSGLPQQVVHTITSTPAQSTRHANALNWKLFVK